MWKELPLLICTEERNLVFVQWFISLIWFVNETPNSVSILNSAYLQHLLHSNYLRSPLDGVCFTEGSMPLLETFPWGRKPLLKEEEYWWVEPNLKPFRLVENSKPSHPPWTFCDSSFNQSLPSNWQLCPPKLLIGAIFFPNYQKIAIVFPS